MNVQSSIEKETPEQQVLYAIERLAKHRAGRLAAKLHLSALQKRNRRDNYLRMATDAFYNQLGTVEGQLFTFSNNDLMFITRAEHYEKLDAAVNRLRTMFQNDPLVHQGGEGVSFCSWYQLDLEYDKLLAHTREAVAEAQQRLFLEAEEPPKKQPQPLFPGLLAKIEDGLSRADLSAMVRSQTACTVIQGQVPQPLYREFFVAIDELRDIVTPGIDLRANRWLFQYLLRLLDQRMLTYVLREMAKSDRAFSLNLNVETILSPEFQKFDQNISTLIRNRLVLELQLMDIFADLGGYIFARDYLQERGYRVCLDGLTHQSASIVDREKLGADLVKLNWTPDGLNQLSLEKPEKLRELVLSLGQARVVMARCEDETALNFGRKAGIIMFQGRVIDRLLQEAKPIGPI